jgi:hypothetical protein
VAWQPCVSCPSPPGSPACSPQGREPWPPARGASW